MRFPLNISHSFLDTVANTLVFKTPHVQLLGSSLLRVGCDLDGQLHGLLQRISGALVYRLHRLDVDTRHHQVVGREAETATHFALLIQSEHRSTNDLGRVLKSGREKKNMIGKMYGLKPYPHSV